MISFAISSSAIPFPHVFLHNALFLSLAVWVGSLSSPEPQPCTCVVPPSYFSFFPQTSPNNHNPATGFSLLPVFFSETSHAFPLQLFSLTVLYLASIFFPLTFTLFLLFSSCLSLGTSDSLFTHFCNYRLSSPFSCFFQVSMFFKIHNLLNFRCGVKWVVVAYPITPLVATNQVEAYCCYWGN